MNSIWEQAEALSPQIIAQRRDLHKFPETGWTEFRTACIVIKKLRQLAKDHILLLNLLLPN